MKKTTTKKSPTGAPLGNPLKFFREGGEQIKAMFKKGGYNTPVQKLIKAQPGLETSNLTAPVNEAGNPLRANVGIGNLDLGYSGNVGTTGITDNKLSAGYTNKGFGAAGTYDLANKSGNIGAIYNNNNGFSANAGYNSKTGLNGKISYTGAVGKSKTPVKVGLTYNKNGGTHKMPNGKVMLNSAMKKKTSKKK